MYIFIVGGGRGNCLAVDDTSILHIMDDKYSIEENEVTIDEVNLVRKYDLDYRPPLQCDHDYTDVPNYDRALHGISEYK